MSAALPIPLVFLAILFAGIAWGQWSRMALCARVSLGGATVFAIAAAKYPGEGTAAVLARTDEGLAYLVAIAAGACAAVVLITALTVLHALRV